MNTVNEIRKELKKNSDPAAVKSSQRFFKEELLLHGSKNTEVRAISKKYFKTVKDLSKEEVFSLCEELWKSGYLEESIIACEWSYSLRKQFTPSDFILFEKWVKTYVNNWASCDTFCNHTVGEFIVLFPEYLPQLKKMGKIRESMDAPCCSCFIDFACSKRKIFRSHFSISRYIVERSG